ncbi:MAG: hypothetical protein IPJ77_17275 [Planctomycetes bacterium]|nr:hypothetical protein [Planctomycetota bacterium]
MQIGLPEAGSGGVSVAPDGRFATVSVTVSFTSVSAAQIVVENGTPTLAIAFVLHCVKFGGVLMKL